MADTRPFENVVVIGPGAIGLVLAIRLATGPDGPRVTLIDYRADRAARLSGRTLRLRGPEGDILACLPVRLVSDSEPDVVFLATKAWAVADAASAAARWIGRAPLVAIQNGLGAAADAASVLPRTPVITAVSYQAANLEAEGVVNHVANLVTHLGYDGRPPDGLVEAVAAMMEGAGLPARVEADIRPLVWGKLIVNAAINPVAALAGEPNGRVAERPSLRAMAQAIAEEAAVVASAAGIELPYPSAVDAVLETARRTAENRCSMLQDLQAGRHTEIDFLSGAIVRTAESCGLTAPMNAAVASLVRHVSEMQQPRQP